MSPELDWGMTMKKVSWYGMLGSLVAMAACAVAWVLAWPNWMWATVPFGVALGNLLFWSISYVVLREVARCPK